MTELLALTYADEYRAAEVLATLQRLHTGGLIEAEDMVSIERAMDWGITLHYVADLRCDELATHQFWRTLITSLLLAPGGESTTVRPESFGLEPEFIRGVEADLPLGSSAVLLLVPRTALARVLPELRSFGGTLLQTTIKRTAGHRLHQRARSGAGAWPITR